MDPRAIRPRLFHWTASHPKIRVEVSSYWLAGARILLDPLIVDAPDQVQTVKRGLRD